MAPGGRVWSLSGVQWGRENAWMWNGTMKWSSLKFRGGGEREKGEEVEERRGSGEGLGKWRSDGGTERGWGRWMGWWGTLGPTRRGGLRTHPLYPRRGVCARLFTSHFFFSPSILIHLYLAVPSFIPLFVFSSYLPSIYIPFLVCFSSLVFLFFPISFVFYSHPFSLFTVLLPISLIPLCRVFVFYSFPFFSHFFSISCISLFFFPNSYLVFIFTHCFADLLCKLFSVCSIFPSNNSFLHCPHPLFATFVYHLFLVFFFVVFLFPPVLILTLFPVYLFPTSFSFLLYFFPCLFSILSSFFLIRSLLFP